MLLGLKREIVERSAKRPYDILVDMTAQRIGSPEARKAAETFFAQLPYRRFAAWGGSPPVNLSVKSLVQAHRDEECVRLFRNELDARAWLADK